MIRGGEKVMYDGPLVAAWVRQRGIIPSHLPARLDRAIRRWANGERAGERLVDDLCAFMGWGSHMATIPQEFIVKGRHLIDPDYEEAA